jgi:hypothetical protein
MQYGSSKKIEFMVKATFEIEENKGASQNILKILLPTLIYMELCQNDFELTMRELLLIGDEVKKVLLSESQVVQDGFTEIFNTILIHIYEKKIPNVFQLKREELEYFRLYFASEMIGNREIQKVYFESAKSICEVYGDKPFMDYMIKKEK